MQRALHFSDAASVRPSPGGGSPSHASRRNDLRLFLMTFVAGFCAFYGLIA